MKAGKGWGVEVGTIQVLSKKKKRKGQVIGNKTGLLGGKIKYMDNPVLQVSNTSRICKLYEGSLCTRSPQGSASKYWLSRYQNAWMNTV